MSSELGQRQVTPLSSGRSSPVNRPSQFRAEEDALKTNKAFRRYASGVERALALFDSTLQEWADYISFLGRLLKALQPHPPDIKAVPLKSVVAQRLSQCLVPELPSGVHQKALEVYAFIFEYIGKDGLSSDLCLYLPGLASTLAFASLSVRPAFLTLFEDHILRIDRPSLRPALKSIILALLPGLEEETAEDYDRIFQLLQSFKASTDDLVPGQTEADHHLAGSFFWQCLFLGSISSPSRRQGVVSFLSKGLPKLDGNPVPGPKGKPDESTEWIPPSIEAVILPEPGLLVRCFATGLADSQLLIQRSFLDLLVTHLPLHSAVIQKRVNAKDLELLILGAVGVTARRDMSLNRRLWAWLLGPEPQNSEKKATDISKPSETLPSPVVASMPSSQAEYFHRYARNSLVNGLKKMVKREDDHPSERARPIRTSLSLMDRWEIGSVIVLEVFLPILRNVKKFDETASSRDSFSEVLRSANVFFDGIESGLIWTQILGLLKSGIGAETSSSGSLEDLELSRFIVRNFNIREEEMLLIHIPMIVLYLLIVLRQDHDTTSGSNIDARKESVALEILDYLVGSIPNRLFHLRANDKATDESETKSGALVASISEFYASCQENPDVSPPPLPTHKVGLLMLREAASFVTQTLIQDSDTSSFEGRLKILIILLKKDRSIRIPDVSPLVQALRRRLATQEQTTSSFSFLAGSTVTLCALIGSSTTAATIEMIESLYLTIFEMLWAYLSPTNPRHHVEAVRCLWQLQQAARHDTHCLEAAICRMLVLGSKMLHEDDIAAARRFAVFWNHSLSNQSLMSENAAIQESNTQSSGVKMPDIARRTQILSRPLFLVLDSLFDESSGLSSYVKNWLQHLSNIERIFFIVAQQIAATQFYQYIDAAKVDRFSATGASSASFPVDVRELTYHLKSLLNVLKNQSDDTWAVLVQCRVNEAGLAQDFMAKVGTDEDANLLVLFSTLCVQNLDWQPCPSDLWSPTAISELRRVSVLILNLVLSSAYSSEVLTLSLESRLLDTLLKSLDDADPFIQVALLDASLSALRLKLQAEAQRPEPGLKRLPSSHSSRGARLSLSTEPSALVTQNSATTQLPLQLLKCLRTGLSSPSSRAVLDRWIQFLGECLPLFGDMIFQFLIPLVETLCEQIRHGFATLKSTFVGSDDSILDPSTAAPETSIIYLFTGAEHILAKSHDQLIQHESKSPVAKSSDQQTGFFENMVSGVFTSETLQTRSASANNRLTVLLAFKDVVQICISIWTWESPSKGVTAESASAASFSYTSLRVRNRTRRILEHLFRAEPLECLETLVEIWCQSRSPDSDQSPSSVLNLLHVLDGSRPQNTVPAIFNSLYSRTNPHVLETSRKSTLTSEIQETDVAMFLVHYLRSLDDDAMNEIWVDCMAFVKDVLSNITPQRHVLPQLLEFMGILGEKVDNTTFGDQRRLRRELGDVFLKLLTATFTSRPLDFSRKPMRLSSNEKLDVSEDQDQMAAANHSYDIITLLTRIVPNLPKILVESDRVLGAATIISTSVVGPLFRSKHFPHNVSRKALELVSHLSKLPNSQKSWKKDVNEAFNDARFFSSSPHLVQEKWLDLLCQWTIADKDRVPELLSRIPAPTTAGIVFGVGASSARLDADRRAQYNLRRVAVLILAAPEDHFFGNVSALVERIGELFNASTASSPSAATRSEVYMVLRALVLKVSAVHLAPLWPVVISELRAVITSMLPEEENQTYSALSTLHACKLLDTLIVLLPDEFQIHEWLFITDTIDAVYKPPKWSPTALADEISEALGTTMLTSTLHASTTAGDSSVGSVATRKPLLSAGVGQRMADEDLRQEVIRPFFSQLSIFAFESTYSLGKADWQSCFDHLLTDLFDDSNNVKST